MASATQMVHEFGVVKSNPIGFELSTTEPICEGMNILLASFQALFIQYQKHHFVVEGAEFLQLHEYFQESYEKVQGHCHDLGERLNGLGGVPVASFAGLAKYCCFEPEADGAYSCRAMLEHDLTAEQEVIKVLRSQISQAESLGDSASRHMLEGMLLETEERAYHLDHFLAADTLVQK